MKGYFLYNFVLWKESQKKETINLKRIKYFYYYCL